MMKPTTKAELQHLVDNWKELDIVLNDVDTSLITDMSRLFKDKNNFNQPLGNWNTGNVTNMRYMFCEASSFNQLLNWDTGNVTNMSSMFSEACSFDQPLNWEAVTNMNSMFGLAISFNQPLTFDTGNVTNMDSLFKAAISFNQNLLNKKREKWAFVKTQYLGNCKKLPTELIKLISQFAFVPWNMENVTNTKDMFADCPSLAICQQI